MESKCKMCDRPATLVKSGPTPNGGQYKEFRCKKNHEVIIRVGAPEDTVDALHAEEPASDQDLELLRELNQRLRKRRAKQDV